MLSANYNPMLLEKYKPSNTKEIIGNASQISQIKSFLDKPRTKRSQALLLSGPTGCGKSISAELSCKELGYDPIVFSSEEKINTKSVIEQSKQQGIFVKKKALIFDETSCPAEIIENSLSPVIIITYMSNHKMRKRCTEVKFSKTRYDTIANFLRNICKKEGIAMTDSSITQIAKSCDGDIRSAIIDIDVGTGDYRERTSTVFETLNVLFRTMDIENARIVMDKYGSDDLEMWLHANVHERYSQTDAASAMKYISKGDVFASRILIRNMWSLDRYKREISVFGTVLSKTKVNNAFMMFKFPFTAKRDAPIEKIGAYVHASRRKAAGYMPLLKRIINKSLAEKMRLTEEEAEMLE